MPPHALDKQNDLASFVAGSGRDETQANVDDILSVVRRHFDMDVAFVSEFVDDHRYFRYVDPPDHQALQCGGSLPLSEGYCKRIVDGELPEVIPDTSLLPAVADIEVTRTLPIGAHVGVPVRLRDSRIYGSFCCFSGKANASLNSRDIVVMRAFADLMANRIDRAIEAERATLESRSRIARAIEGEGRSIVFQPVYRLPGQEILGVEGLSRFAYPAGSGPDRWFADAAAVGLLPDLECAAIASALAAVPQLPESAYLAVNVSPATVVDPRFDAVLQPAPIHRIVIEVTEHADVSDYAALARTLAPLRRRGLRLAVDDAGAGYASFQHILNLRPDIIKLDMSLTRNVDSDRARRSLLTAMVHFATDVGCELIAEGVETTAELQTLMAFGVTMAQGFRLAPPGPLERIFPHPAGV